MTSDTKLLMYAERFLNENTRTYSKWASYTEARPDFDPTGDSASFKVIAYRLPKSAIHLYEAGPTERVRKLYVEEDGSAWLCVHPQVISDKADDIYLRKIQSLATNEREIEVVPSASTRTLFVKGSKPFHAVKLHFPFQISRYGRRMRDEVVHQAIITSTELQNAVEAGKFGRDFAYLRESLGISIRDGEKPGGDHWGYVVREMEPFPPAESDNRAMVPAFAMYGRDKFDPAKPPMLLSILETHAKDPKNYVLEKIMFPIIRHWLTAFKELGLLLEPHGQNTLVEFDESGDITRIVHRDLDLWAYLPRRREMDVSCDNLMPICGTEESVYLSITFDKFVGNHHFENLAKLLQTEFGIDPQELRDACKEEFARHLPNHEKYLPRTIHYFSDERDEANHPIVIDTKEAPLWRP